MDWTIKLTETALKQLKKIDKPTARRIRDYLQETASTGQPRSRGKALTGKLSGYWRYRVGNYRIIADIVDNDLVIIGIDIGHRSEIYDR